MSETHAGQSEKQPAAPTAAAEDGEFLILHKSSPAQELLTLALLLALLVVLRFEAILKFNSSYLGGFQRDAGLYVWLLKANLRDLFTLPWFNTGAFYPYGRTLAWSDNFILPALAARPLLSLGLSQPAAYNAVLLGAMLLNGYCMSRLCFRLSGDRVAALAGGGVFMGLSYFGGNLGHPQLQFLFWAPLALEGLFSFMARPALLPAVLCGLCISASFLCSVYYSIFAALLVGAVFLAALILKGRRFSARHYLLLAGGLLAGMLPLLPFLPPYLDVRATFGSRALYEAHYFSATFLSYLSASPFNLFYGWSSSFSHDEAHLFPGFLLLAAAMLSLRRLSGIRRLRLETGLFLLFLLLTCVFSLDQLHLLLPGPLPNYLCALCMWLALGSLMYLLYRVGMLERKLGYAIMTNRGLLGIFLFSLLFFFLLSLGPQGNPEKKHVAAGVFTVLHALLPGFDSIRAVGRIGVLSLFSLCMLFSLGLAQLRRAGKMRLVFPAALSLLILAENYVKVYPLEAPREAPAVFEKLAAVSDGQSALVVLPWTAEVKFDGEVKSWGDFAEKNVSYMHWAFPVRLPLVNGYSGQRSKLMRELPADLEHFPDAESMRALGSIAGLRYLVYLPSLIPGFDSAAFETRLSATPGLAELARDGAGNLLLEYSATREINDPAFYLLSPSWPAGRLRLELMMRFQPGTPVAGLTVSAADGSKTTTLQNLELKCDGQWHEYEFALPARRTERVRPVRLSFRSSEGQSVFLRKSGFAAAH